MPLFEFECECGWRGRDLAKDPPLELECGKCGKGARRVMPSSLAFKWGPGINPIHDEGRAMAAAYLESDEVKAGVKSGELIEVGPSERKAMVNRGRL